MEIEKIASAGEILSLQRKEIKSGEVKGKFVDFLKEIDRGERFMDNVIRKGAKGGDFSPQELIAIQAGVYDYSYKLELFAKIVDKAASSIRQVLSPQ